jgi:hypothetical protein
LKARIVTLLKECQEVLSQAYRSTFSINNRISRAKTLPTSGIKAQSPLPLVLSMEQEPNEEPSIDFASSKLMDQLVADLKRPQLPAAPHPQYDTLGH